MNRFSVQMLGKFRIEYLQKVWEIYEWNKARELLCFLLINRHRSFTREELASRFWPDSSMAQGKKNLRQSIWRLHSEFELPEQRSARRLLSVTSEQLRINPVLDIWIDVEELRRTYSNLRTKPELDEQDAQALSESAALYGGDFLEGWYQDWPLSERDQLQGIYLEILGKLVSHCITQGNYQMGIDYGEKILHYDPASERTHQHLMRQHYLVGNRTLALHQFKRCVKSLRDELDVSPSKSTLTIYHQIRNDDLTQLAYPSDPSSSVREFTAQSLVEIPEVVARLAELQVAMGDIRFQIQHQARLIEKLLSLGDPSGN